MSGDIPPKFTEWLPLQETPDETLIAARDHAYLVIRMLLSCIDTKQHLFSEQQEYVREAQALMVEAEGLK